MNRATDDLISRAAAIEICKSIVPNTNPDFYNLKSKAGYSSWMHSNGEAYATINIEIEIKKLPAVAAVPVVHGRWVKMTGMMPPEYHGHYECSECGWHMKGLRNSWTREEELSYCPNCGAKMEIKDE